VSQEFLVSRWVRFLLGALVQVLLVQISKVLGSYISPYKHRVKFLGHPILSIRY
jgi:hypothetical protein